MRPTAAATSIEAIGEPLTGREEFADARKRRCQTVTIARIEVHEYQAIFPLARPLHVKHAADRLRGSRVTTQLYERGIMKRLIALALAATFALPSFALLSGCNTVEGAGKDISAGGNKIKEEARENKKY